jgi:3-hydroxyacyl-CoA dehydrogenase
MGVIMSRFSKDYDHFAESILIQCGFKENLFEEIAKNITHIIRETANTHSLSQTIQKLEDKVANDESGILLRFFIFTATMAFVDFISKDAIVQRIGHILEQLPKEICTKCEHMKKSEDSDTYICNKTLDECPFYLKLSQEEKDAISSLQSKE